MAEVVFAVYNVIILYGGVGSSVNILLLLPSLWKVKTRIELSYISRYLKIFKLKSLVVKTELTFI